MGLQTRHPRTGLNQIIVKFREGGEIDEYEDGTLVAKPYSLDGFYEVLAQEHEVRVRRSFSLNSRDMREFQRELEQSLGKTFPFLNLYVRVTPPPDTDLKALAKELSRVQEIERVSLAGPLSAPQFSADVDLSAEQTYLGPGSEGGIDAHHAWKFPGGKGGMVTVCDCEWGFNADHVDLPPVSVIYNPDSDLSENENHGTKALGVLAAPRSAVQGIKGIAGICHKATVKFASVSATDTPDLYDHNAGDAIQEAIDTLSGGDVLVLELQALVDGTTWAPVEWDEDLRNLIALAPGKDITVVQAAGNGGEDLADFETAEGDHIWDPDLEDEYVNTQSIIVGAGYAPGHPAKDPRAWRSDSNYGKRVDCQGWGNGVVTTGCCLVFNGGANQQWTYFGGTSAATAMVGGAAACVQSAAIRNLTGGYFEPEDLREMFRDPDNGSYQPGNEPEVRVSGEPADGSDAAENWIGSLPDLRKLLAGAGIFAGFYLRDFLDDLGVVSLKYHQCLGPDVIPLSGVLDPVDPVLGSAAWGDPDIGENMVLDEKRYIYVRGRNRGPVRDRGSVTIYWSRPSMYLHPSLWKKIETIPLRRGAGSSYILFEPVESEPVGRRAEGPAVLITVVRSKLDPAAVPGAGSSTEEFLAFLHERKDIRFRCVWDMNVASGVESDPFRLELRGLRDRNATFRFEVTPRLPSGTVVEAEIPDGSLSLPRRHPNPFAPKPLQHVFKRNRPLVIDGIGIRKKARVPADLKIQFPDGARPGIYSIAIDQYWGKKHLGRMNFRLHLEEAP